MAASHFRLTADGHTGPTVRLKWGRKPFHTLVLLLPTSNWGREQNQWLKRLAAGLV